MPDPSALASAAGAALTEVAKNPNLGWLLFRKKMTRALTNKIVGEFTAARDAKKEIAKIQEQDRLEFVPEHDLPVAELQTRAIENFFYDQSWQQNNRDTIAVLVHDSLTRSGFMDTDEGKNPDATPHLDEDFMARFYRYAGDISKEEAQQLWAKLLAGEIQKPGSFSVYALEMLRSMTKQDLEYMNLLSGFMFGNKLLMPAEPASRKSYFSNMFETARVLDGSSFSPSRAPDAGKGIYHPAFERLKQLGLCSGLADSAITLIPRNNCNQILLRNGTLSIPCPSDTPVSTLLVATIDTHSAFFELAALLEPEPFPVAGIISLCMVLGAYNVLYLFEFIDDYRIDPTTLQAGDLYPAKVKITSAHEIVKNLSYVPPKGSLAEYLLSDTVTDFFLSGIAKNDPHAATLTQLTEDLNNCETITEVIETIQAVFREDRGEEE